MFDTDILSRVKRPAAYLGAERGSRAKSISADGVSWVLAFPDAYELGSTHTGFQIIYHVLNEHEKSSADRIFAPWEDYETELKRTGRRLCSLEKDRPLDEFDVLGFSLAYELSYTNVLKILDLGGIPLRTADRGREYPLVVGGGVCSVNPEPMAPFIDAFVVGEGEEVAIELSEAVGRWKKSGTDRHELLDEVAKIEGVYVPERWKEGEKIRARRIRDLDSAPYPVRPVIPSIAAIHDRVAVEIARGCPHSCRFCQAGFIYRPLRERSPGRVMELAKDSIRNTGFSDLTLLSLSTGDYPAITSIIRRLKVDLDEFHTAVNLPSLRAGTLTEEAVDLIGSVRKTGFTIAPEAGSERLRRVINKGITDKQILDTARTIYSNGWKLIKLYFMFGLPTETQEDLDAIEKLVRRIRQVGLDVGIKPNINVSLGAFVPKPHTPFQWEPMLGLDAIYDSLSYLKKRLKIPGVKVSWSDPKVSFLEGVMARGDRSVADAIETAYRMGASFDGWGDRLKFDVWEKAFERTGIDAAAMATGELLEGDKLPWRHIKIGSSNKFLREEARRAREETYTPGCGSEECEGECGGCTPQVAKTRAVNLLSERKTIVDSKNSEEYHRYRVFYRKVGPARFLGHLDTIRAVQQTLRRAAFPLRYTEGFHPLPRTRFGPPLPLGIASLSECFDVDFIGAVDTAGIVERFNEHNQPGLVAMTATEIELNKPAPQEAMKSVRYRFEVPEQGSSDPYGRMDILKSFMDAETFNIELEKKNRKRIINLKDYVVDIKIFVGAAVEIEMNCDNNGAVPRVGAVWEAIFGKLPPYSRVIKIGMEMA